MTTFFGCWGVSTSGAMRRWVLGPAMCVCDACGTPAERHRVFYNGHYREYLEGSFCEGCAVKRARFRAAADDRARKDRIRQQLEDT
jgi:hypothetical protein